MLHTNTGEFGHRTHYKAFYWTWTEHLTISRIRMDVNH